MRRTRPLRICGNRRKLGQAADEKAGQVAQAVVVEFARLERDEGDPLERFGRRGVGGADGRRGLTHAARPVDERAPGARLGIERVGDPSQLVLAAEERLKRGEIMGNGGARCIAGERGRRRKRAGLRPVEADAAFRALPIIGSASVIMDFGVIYAKLSR